MMMGLMPLLRQMLSPALVALVVWSGGAPDTAMGQARKAQEVRVPADFTEVARPLLPAVVNISTSMVVDGPGTIPPGLPDQFREFFEEFFNTPEGGQRRGTALGSGFLISADGYIVSNNHVVEEADTITVVLHDEREFEATVVGRDPRTDIAVLKIDAGESLPFVQWGDSDAAEVGNWILAIGNPFGLGGTVTTGIISAKARNIGVGPYDSFLQTDASINRGNSGGPMFNMQGLVIGVNTAIFSPTGGNIGIGFATPSSIAQDVVQQIIQTGEVRRGWLGVTIQPVTPEAAQALGLEQARGVLVADVTPGSPADQAGLQPGDVIVQYRGDPINDVDRLPRAVAETGIGETVKMAVLREGQEKTVRVTIGNLAQSPEMMAEGPGDRGEPGGGEGATLGLALAPLTPEARRQVGIDPSVSGVLVQGVEAGSLAAQRGLAAGDVILRVGQQKVEDPRQVRDMIEQARAAGRNSALMLIHSEGRNRYVTLPLQTGGPQQGLR